MSPILRIPPVTIGVGDQYFDLDIGDVPVHEPNIGQTLLKGAWVPPGDWVWDAWRDKVALRPDQFVELQFEDVKRDPVGEIERTYAHLGIEFSERHRSALESYLSSVADYRKNKFNPLSPEQLEKIWPKLRSVFDRGGYKPNG